MINFREYDDRDCETDDENLRRQYIAGFFDAEGTIALNKDKRFNSFGITISIKQTYKPVLNYINHYFHSNILKYMSKHKNRKDSYRLDILEQDYIRFLEYIYPNLIEKKKQAELMLYYLREVKPAYRNYFRVTESQRRIGDYINKELQILKHVKYGENELKNYENEIKKLKIPNSIIEGKQSTLISLEEIYEEMGIEDFKKVEISNIPNEISIGYFSGFYDGERYIGIQKGHRDSYTLRVAVTNSNIDILNLYKNKFGGKIRPKSNKNSKEFHKKLYLWEIFNDDSLLFLKALYPYTKVKKEQIYFGLKFQEWHNSINIIKNIEQKKKAEYYRLIIELKKAIGEIDEDDKYNNNENLIDKFQSTLEF